MSIDEKLDWLHDYVNSLADTVNTNVYAANQQFDKITRALKAVEAAVQSIAADLKRRDGA
ncbi:MAG TPA: hypothetical protein VGJ20_37415 [Xanthobacteraceae bacterium]